MAASPSVLSPSRARRPARAFDDGRTPASQPLGANETAFVTWLASSPEHAPVGPAAPQVTGGLEHILGSGASSPSALPKEAAAAIAVSPRTTIGEACTLLLWAVQDPTGPRCRSYRSAVFFLRHRVDDAVPSTPPSTRGGV